jgi:acyl carrier protein
MAAALSETHKRRLSERGMGTITLRGGLAALEMALGFDRPQLVIMPARWDILARRIGPHAPPPLLRKLLDGAAASAPRPGAPSILERLAGATPEERAALVHEHLRAVVSAALGLAQGQIDPNQPLTDLGLDSLMAVEVRNGASSAFGIALSPADILDGASTTVLANRVVALLSAEAGTPGGDSVQTDTDPEAAATAELLANLDKLSDDQVDELLSLLAVGDQRDDVSDLTVGRA